MLDYEELKKEIAQLGEKMINYQRDEVVEKITRVRNILAIYEDEWDKEIKLLNEALELLGAKDG
jgi:hypothetical protein